ncbi:MAG: hypothetical protein IH927_05255 [Proteobacteria bacterium]|nr:hypothetical protein [Pseudomonadota bacterium]
MNHNALAKTDIVRAKSVNSSVTNQQERAPWARRVLGLFVVAWLNLALLPCAMALGEMQESGCPHGAPAVSGEIPPLGADGSNDMHAGDASCCEVETSRCAFLDDYKYDGRTVQIKVKDAPGDLPVGIVPAVVAIPVTDSVPASLDFRDVSLRPGNRLPLNLLYCVYLI